MITSENEDMARYDGALVRRVVGPIQSFLRLYHRSEVQGMDGFPSGGALVVSNHSGGLLAVDIPLIAASYYAKWGYQRPLYALCHDIILAGPTGDLLRRLGCIRATRANALAALQSGAAVVVFPGGEFDAYRPSTAANTIDFDGRTGYVQSALDARVPIVPVVSIGGHQTQWYLTRGRSLAKKVGLTKYFRLDALPLSLGFPFGLSTGVPINLPLPSKIVARVLPPIDLDAEFGSDPDVAEVDAHVRKLMQDELTDLAQERRFPVLG